MHDQAQCWLASDKRAVSPHTIAFKKCSAHCDLSPEVLHKSGVNPEEEQRMIVEAFHFDFLHRTHRRYICTVMVSIQWS